MEVRKAGYSQTGDQAKGQSSQPKPQGAPSASKDPLTLWLTSECTGDNGSGGRKRFENIHLAIGSRMDLRESVLGQRNQLRKENNTGGRQ